MKAILVMEMPENCLECPCCDACGESCQVADREIGTYEDNYINGQYDKPGWCPLVPMPEKKEGAQYGTYSDGFFTGWNACLDAIEGGGGKRMDDIADMEHCSIIDTICPYEHGCTWCRLHNDYEDAREKARRIEEEMKRREG